MQVGLAVDIFISFSSETMPGVQASLSVASREPNGAAFSDTVVVRYFPAKVPFDRPRLTAEKLNNHTQWVASASQLDLETYWQDSNIKDCTQDGCPASVSTSIAGGGGSETFGSSKQCFKELVCCKCRGLLPLDISKVEVFGLKQAVDTNATLGVFCGETTPTTTFTSTPTTSATATASSTRTSSASSTPTSSATSTETSSASSSASTSVTKTESTTPTATGTSTQTTSPASTTSTTTTVALTTPTLTPTSTATTTATITPRPPTLALIFNESCDSEDPAYRPGGCDECFLGFGLESPMCIIIVILAALLLLCCCAYVLFLIGPCKTPPAEIEPFDFPQPRVTKPELLVETNDTHAVMRMMCETEDATILYSMHNKPLLHANGTGMDFVGGKSSSAILVYDDNNPPSIKIDSATSNANIISAMAVCKLYAAHDSFPVRLPLVVPIVPKPIFYKRNEAAINALTKLGVLDFKEDVDKKQAAESQAYLAAVEAMLSGEVGDGSGDINSYLVQEPGRAIVDSTGAYAERVAELKNQLEIEVRLCACTRALHFASRFLSLFTD